MQIGDVIMMEKEYIRGYDFYKITKVTPKLVYGYKLKTKKTKLDNPTNFYGNWICECIDEMELSGNYPDGCQKRFKKTEVEIINKFSYEYEIYE